MRATILLALLALSSAAHAQPAQPTRTVAVTVDDLPFVSRRFPQTAAQRAMSERLVAALRAHDVPAVGFVNEGKLWRDGRVDSGQVAILRLWADAGLELGNHTWSHVDLHRVPARAFIADLARGDSLTRRVLAERGRTPRWFRHPFLHTGRTLGARDSVHAALAERGYQVAPVTLDNYDYVFANAYDAALGRRDSTEARRVADAYVAYMTQVFAYYEEQARRIEGRDIPHVLLLHASALNADTFDRLARMIRARGYAFAPLADVLADPVYRSADTFTGSAGITWLHRWALSRGVRGATFAGEPEVPADIATAGR